MIKKPFKVGLNFAIFPLLVNIPTEPDFFLTIGDWKGRVHEICSGHCRTNDWKDSQRKEGCADHFKIVWAFLTSKTNNFDKIYNEKHTASVTRLLTFTTSWWGLCWNDSIFRLFSYHHCLNREVSHESFQISNYNIDFSVAGKKEKKYLAEPILWTRRESCGWGRSSFGFLKFNEPRIVFSLFP